MNTDMNNESRQIYLVLSQTGTLLSRILKRITKAKYNHASISITEDMKNMYSFGRINAYNAFHGGYVKESISEGMFKRFYKTDAAVFSISVSESKYTLITETLEEMYRNKSMYHYNTLGLFTALFGYYYKRENRYYCSDFVYKILTDFEIIPCGKLDRIVKPIDFYEIFRETLIYEGKFQEYGHTATTVPFSVIHSIN